MVVQCDLSGVMARHAPSAINREYSVKRVNIKDLRWLGANEKNYVAIYFKSFVNATVMVVLYSSKNGLFCKPKPVIIRR